MNPNVKTKLDALMAEHEAKQLKLKEAELKLNTEAQSIFDEIKDDVLATAYFQAKTAGKFTNLLSTLESIFAERFGYVHPKVTLKVHVLCDNMLLISGFDINASGNDYGVWTLKTVLNDGDINDATHVDQSGDKWLFLNNKYFVFKKSGWCNPMLDTNGKQAIPVLNDISEPPEPELVTPVGLSAKETKLYLWIAYPLAVIIITLVCTL